MLQAVRKTTGGLLCPSGFYLCISQYQDREPWDYKDGWKSTGGSYKNLGLGVGSLKLSSTSHSPTITQDLPALTSSPLLLSSHHSNPTYYKAHSPKRVWWKRDSHPPQWATKSLASRGTLTEVEIQNHESTRWEHTDKCTLLGCLKTWAQWLDIPSCWRLHFYISAMHVHAC